MPTCPGARLHYHPPFGTPCGNVFVSTSRAAQNAGRLKVGDEAVIESNDEDDAFEQAQLPVWMLPMRQSTFPGALLCI